MIVQLLRLGFLASLSVAQKLIPVSVGRTGDALSLRFSPEEVFADVGDLIQFQFYPVNHSAVQADFGAPCVPTVNSTTQGFFSGFRPLPLNTKTLLTFTITVTNPSPIFFYCSQGRHCQQGFVGAINPTTEQTLAAFRLAAVHAPESLSPGEVAYHDAPEPQTESVPTSTALTAPDSRPGVGVGAIVGGAVGGAVALVVAVVAVVLLAARRRRRREASAGARARARKKYIIGNPTLPRGGVYG